MFLSRLEAAPEDELLHSSDSLSIIGKVAELSFRVLSLEFI